MYQNMIGDIMTKGQILINHMPTAKKLTTKEIYQLIDEYQATHDEKIKEELIIGNLKLVISMTKRFYQRTDSIEDLFQVGIIGLIKAIEHFDTSYQLQFSTYAVPLIIGEMKRFLRDNSSLKISRTIRDLAYTILKVKDEYLSHEHREPTIEELSRDLNVDRKDIVEALLSTNTISSFQEQVSHDDDNDIKLIDAISDDYDIAMQYHNHVDLIAALEQLNDKQKYVINQRYFAGLSQSEIAKELFISQAQVSRIEKNAIHLLHKLLS